MDKIRVGRFSRQEHDRNRCGPFALLDSRCQIEAAHVRHHDIEEKNREVLLEESEERFSARRGFDDPVIRRRQDRSKSAPVLGMVVNDEKRDRLATSSPHLLRRFRTMAATSCSRVRRLDDIVGAASRQALRPIRLTPWP